MHLTKICVVFWNWEMQMKTDILVGDITIHRFKGEKLLGTLNYIPQDRRTK